VPPSLLARCVNRLLGPERDAHPERAMWVCAPPEGEKQESSDPRTDRARVAVELV